MGDGDCVCNHGWIINGFLSAEHLSYGARTVNLLFDDCDFFLCLAAILI